MLWEASHALQVGQESVQRVEPVGDRVEEALELADSGGPKKTISTTTTAKKAK